MSLSRWISRWRRPTPPPPQPFQGDEGQRLHDALPKTVRRAFARFYLDPSSDVERRESGQEALIQAVCGLAKTDLSVPEWLCGYRRMLASGCFRLGGVFRDKALELALLEADSANSGKDALITGYCAALDQSDLDRARDLLHKLHHVKKVGRATLARLTGHLELHAGNLPAFYELNPKPADPPDARFLEYIESRTVAMVGPAAGTAKQGQEIDSFDLIARSNHRGVEIPYDPAVAGSRSDFSFYAHANLELLHKNNEGHRFMQWLDTIDWAVMKGLDFPFQQDAAKTGKLVLRRWNPLFFHGHPNLTPSNLYTLLFFRAGRIKIFNSNFYFSSTPYAAGYINKLNLGIMFGSMAGHDSVSQLNFMRTLYRAGLMEMDPESAAVVNLSSAAYLAGLERTFVNPAIPMPEP